MRAVLARAALLAGLAVALAVPSMTLSSSGSRDTRVVLALHARTKASNVRCALHAPVERVLSRLGGFAARLSENEVNRLAADPEIGPVLPDPGSYVVRIESKDPAVVEARTKELERRLEFTSDNRYTSPIFGGFAAVLGWAQLDRLDDQAGVQVKPDPWVYILFYVPGVDVDARTDDLERRYGFTARHRYRALGGFSAELTKAQLAGIVTEQDISLIGPDARGFAEPSRAACLRSSPRLRKQLRAAFVRAHPGLSGTRLRGPSRVRLASDAPFGGKPVRHALASFSHPRLEPVTQPEAFRSSTETRFRWRALGPTNGVVCLDENEKGLLSRDVLRAWLLPRASSGCYRTR
jgi:hypothetical protein